MHNKIHISPGVSNNGIHILDNDELPPKDMVINDLGGNSTVYPSRLQHLEGVLIDGVKDEWFEYVPASYDGRKKVPLVISCHGGGQRGWGQAVATAWYCVAERENFIVVYPSAQDKRWKVNKDTPDIDTENNHDIHYILALINEMSKKYAIDSTRIYMCGMSMGDMMTMSFARTYGNLLAGAANAEGPSGKSALFLEDGSPASHVCAVPVFQSRGELDDMSIYPGVTRGEVNALNRHYWSTINGCTSLPKLNIENENNFAFYHGEKADFIYRDVKDRNHGQTFDDAEYIWQMFFSGLSRNSDGGITRSKALTAHIGDKSALAFASNSKKVYTSKGIVEMETAAFYMSDKNKNFISHEVTHTYDRMYVPASSLNALFSIKAEYTDDGKRALLYLTDGRVLQLAANIMAVTIDDRVYCMSRQAEMKDGQLCLPIKWLAENVLNLYTTECNEALYISTHRGAMTPDMAVIIKEILS